MMKKHTSKKIAKRTLLIIGILLLVLIITAVTVFLVYYLRMYEKIPINDRTDEYTVDTKPDISDEAPDNVVDEYLEDGETSSDDMESDWLNLNLDEDYVYEEPAEAGIPIYHKEQKNPDILNILLIGRDSRSSATQRGRSDCMIVLSYNKVTGDVKMISLMRDILVPIEGYGWNRLNTPYVFGGIGLCINTINELFDLDIQNYISINFKGIKNIVDAIGGIDVTLDEGEVELYTSYGFKGLVVGVNHMDGYFALRHLTNRWVGGDGDFSRTRRHRDVLLGIYDKVMNNCTASQIADLVKYCSRKVSTNITIPTLISTGTAVLKTKDLIKITTFSAPFDGDWKYGWYNDMSILDVGLDATAKKINNIIYGDGTPVIQ